MALAARERGGPKLCLQVLAYPMLDDRTAARPDPQRGYRRLWTNESNRFAWTTYLGHEPGIDGVSPLAAPARSEDLAGLPPAWIGVGDLDLFYDECLAYATALQDAGVECRTYVVPGAFHGFDGIGQSKPVSRDWRSEQVSALRAAFAVNRH